MKEELINYKTAILANKKGFAEYCNFCYDEKNSLIQIGNYNGVDNDVFPSVSAPTQSLLQKWLREIHGIKVYIVPSILSSRPDNWIWMLDKYENGIYIGRMQTASIFDTYEIALEKGLFEALNLLPDVS